MDGIFGGVLGLCAKSQFLIFHNFLSLWTLYGGSRGDNTSNLLNKQMNGQASKSFTIGELMQSLHTQSLGRGILKKSSWGYIKVCIVYCVMTL